MGEYIMENPNEAKRLERQAKLKNYSLEMELKNIEIKNGADILDAGCGSGLLSRYLSGLNKDLHLFACDLSEQRLEDAKKLSQNQAIAFFKQDLTELSKQNKKFDLIFNRYVAHHLNFETYLKVLIEFYNSLKNGGQVAIIDIDGILVNLGTTDIELEKMITKLHDTFDGDAFMGRKIPQMLSLVGFKNVKWSIELMDFQGAEREHEVEQFKERFEYGMPLYEKTFGSLLAAKQFQKKYLDELKRIDTALFYNKFIITAQK